MALPNNIATEYAATALIAAATEKTTHSGKVRFATQQIVKMRLKPASM
jgi:hypothetical protein